jgi:peptidoglycan/LPS O-acetylase OafA/YrhL
MFPNTSHQIEALAAQSVSAPEHGVRRSAWIDNARTAVIVLVVNMHCSVTYSHVGGWYLKDGPEGSLSEKLPYIFWIFHLQSFFMGLLFFLAGSFADGAIRRRGPASFVRERLFRLGLPALLYMAVLQPLIVYGLLGAAQGEADTSWPSIYLHYLASGQFLGGSGPMWFVLALLAFSAFLAAWRAVFAANHLPAHGQAPSAQSLWAFAAVLALATALTRCVFPIGTSFYNFQLGYFPQYIAAFAVGVAAGKAGWLNDLAASRRAKFAGYLALFGGPLLLGLVLYFGGAPSEGPGPGEHGPILYFGGWSLQAFGAAMWEQFAGVGLALGMMAWCWRRFPRESSVSRWLAERSFAVYLFHAPILVALTLLFRPIQISQLAHVLLLTVAGLVLSFAVADLATRMPGLRSIL